ncbi:MAG: hypothetical protein V3T72_11050 [Thermoanaerobaculia bacterium]
MSRLLSILLLLTLCACSPSEQATTSDELPTTLTPQDSGWPRQFSAEGTTVTIYEPQIEGWYKYSRITFRAAVSFVAEDGAEPVFGALRVQADTDTDLENRSVLLGNMEIESTKFLTLDDEAAAAWTERLEGILPRTPMPVALDRLLAYFEHTEAELVADDLEARARPASRNEISHDAPLIFVSQRPAILVLLDGEPVLSPIEGTELLFAVNTNWDLFFHSKGGRYYLLDRGPQEDGEHSPAEPSWLTATAIDSPWTAADELSADFLRLPEDWAEVRSLLPGQTTGRRLTAGELPAVYAATRPAELIVLDGAPELTPIAGTRLMWAQNTDSDLFLYGGDGSYYYLVSGRWFRSRTLDGPWEFATTELPEEFSDIPPDHPRASVLASVPGSAQAEEAVRLARVPTKATVQRSEAEAEVAYQGEPEFAAIEDTSMAYATNTSSDVIRFGDLYYLCLQGVWFVSSNATGPWQVADSVADEIYTIPVSSPVHHTTYVTVYDSGPDWVTVGYTAAYLGLMIAIIDSDPIVVYGTGWYHPPYVHYGPRPVYYPYHHSYGVAAYYNPHTGAYGRGASVYGPYGGAGRAAAYNPRTGTYARGASAWGPYGGSAAFQAYNPRTDTYRAGYRSASPYASWGEGVVSRGDRWVHGGYYSDRRGTVAGVRTSEGDRAVAVRGNRGGRALIGGSGNAVFVGRDGNVYKRDDDGWSKRGRAGWDQVESRAVSSGLSDGQRAGARDRASQAAASRGGSAGAGLSDSQRAEARNRASQAASSRGGSAGAGLSDSQRAEARDRAAEEARARAGAGAGAGARGANRSGSSADRAGSLGNRSWDSSSSQQDVLRQLDRESRARSAGSARARDFQSRQSDGDQNRSRQGGTRQRRGGRRGRG